MHIQGKLLSYGEDLSEAIAIRRTVFVEELQIPEEIEFDEYDAEAMHVIVYENKGNKKAVATGRIVFDSKDCKIERIAVLKEYRGNGYGDFVVRMLINRAFRAGIKEVMVNSEISMEPFFGKIGFSRVRDEENTDINYHKMNINANNMTTLCNSGEN